MTKKWKSGDMEYSWVISALVSQIAKKLKSLKKKGIIEKFMIHEDGDNVLRFRVKSKLTEEKLNEIFEQDAQKINIVEFRVLDSDVSDKEVENWHKNDIKNCSKLKKKDKEENNIYYG